MATFYDYYVINIFYNDTKIDEISPEEYSFAISDSIYNLYPTAMFTFHDIGGLFQEGLVTAPGAKVKIEYGDKDNLNTCEFTVLQDELLEPEHHTILSGYIDIPLIHAWYNDQEMISKGYQDKISNIISDLTDKYNFEEVDIDETENNDYWLQTQETNAHFIKNTLLPNCFSVNANKTPFFAFITSDNIFHLRNYHSMSNQKTYDKIIYKSHLVQEDNSNIIIKNRALHIKRWRESLKALFPHKNRKLFKIDRNDGTLVVENDPMKNHPVKGGWSIPIMNDTGNLNSYVNLQFTETSTGRKQNLTGQSITPLRDTLFIDYFQVIVSFNPIIHSGGLIDLMVYMPNQNEESTKIAKNLAGKYLVLNCEHSWNHESLMGYTSMILGRQYTQLPESYVLKSRLIS